MIRTPGVDSMILTAPEYAGMSKEVRGLMMGDGVPPVQVQEVRYKTKPKIARRIRPW